MNVKMSRVEYGFMVVLHFNIIGDHLKSIKRIAHLLSR